MKKYYIKGDTKVLKKYGYGLITDEGMPYYEKEIYSKSYDDDVEYSYINIGVETSLIVNVNTWTDENYDIDFNDIKDLLLAGLVEERDE